MATGKTKNPFAVVTIYTHTGSYKNDLNVELTLSDNVSNYRFIKITCYVGSISSTSRFTLFLPAYMSASYVPALTSATFNTVRLETHDNKATIISSSHSSVYVRSIDAYY